METNGNATSSGNSAKQRIGVADYFAIVGVGEDLIWKHAGQQNSNIAGNGSSNSNTSNNNATRVDDTDNSYETKTNAAVGNLILGSTKNIPEEDDAMLMERFYREIVHIDIVLAEEQANPQQHASHHHEENDEGSVINATNTTSTTTVIYPSQSPLHRPSQNSYNHYDQQHNTQQISQSASWDTVYTSTTVLSSNTPITLPHLSLTKPTAEIEPVELEGWTVVQQTRPASVPAATSQHCLWKKGQVWEANLDPMGGITGQILFLFLQQQQKKLEKHERQQDPGHQQPGSNSKRAAGKTALTDLRKRVQSTFQSKSQHWLPGRGDSDFSTRQRLSIPFNNTKFYLTYKRRSPEEPNLPGIADASLYYVQIHKSTVLLKRPRKLNDTNQIAAEEPKKKTLTSAATLLEVGKKVVADHLASLPQSPGKRRFGDATGYPSPDERDGSRLYTHQDDDEHARGPPVSLETFLVDLPSPLHEWVIPSAFSVLRFPTQNPDHRHNNSNVPITTVLYASGDSNPRPGIEAVDHTPIRHTARDPSQHATHDQNNDSSWMERLRPRLLDPSDKKLMAAISEHVSFLQDRSVVRGDRVIAVGGRSLSFDDIGDSKGDGDFIYIPVLAVRRQRTGEEERFLEDPALVDIAISFKNDDGSAVLPATDLCFAGDSLQEDDDDDDKSLATKLLHKTKWEESSLALLSDPFAQQLYQGLRLGPACVLVRRNEPMGFCDAAFSTRVLDRFPLKNYKGLPLPEEELPMFCYPTGCRLHRAKFSDAPLPQYYGFVVKNERGDSIFVSCVSFMEPLTNSKKEQLSKLSEKRRRVSLPHKRYWTSKLRKSQQSVRSDDYTLSEVTSPSDFIDVEDNFDHYTNDESNWVLTAFDQMTTFENKTICLVSRYPYWTAFRRFLSHLHSISGTSSDLPLERYISHLLLCVPVPKPGGPKILIPFPTFNFPIVLSSPPENDLPLVDLSFERLVSCLDVPTIVTMVLGFLALERKVIVMSSRPSLVLDVCECARSLLFPFELVAPYVPRLTEPFMSCLDFPGAIFVGIHDDGSQGGLAATVRKNMPEDSTIIDLDSGNVDCSADRMSVLDKSWGIIPHGPRSGLISELETLCRDASIVPGQEPLDSQLDSAFEASRPVAMVEDDIPLSNTQREPLDDRAIRDAFLRFFCYVLAGYERYLVAPDVDFLISGNEWFDSKGFLASATEENSPFLGALVSTQLFQSFIQRRTEASDVHLLLFDECLQEFHSSTVPYGRLGGDVETFYDKDSGKSHMLYSLLVDQSASQFSSNVRYDRSLDADSREYGSETDNSSGHHMSKSLNSDVTERLLRFTEFGINASDDWVTMPSKKDIPRRSCYIYCVDGNPTFPDRLNPALYNPRQPESWLIEMTTGSTPMLTRSALEKEEAERRRKFSTSYRGMHNQRKCLWQLPKLMGSHFLGVWLLCIPSLVSQPCLSHEYQSKYLLRAFGALRLLRSKQKIVPDEAAYRALIVACGRTKHDRRSELVKLFGLLRSDGIFPSAVTLGQYTKALAEGYSKRTTGTADEDSGSVAAAEAIFTELGIAKDAKKAALCVKLDRLDGNLDFLEDSGRRWRQKPDSEKDHGTTNEQNDGQKRRQNGKYWVPVVASSSFLPIGTRIETIHSIDGKNDVHLFALWSRTVKCQECSYIPLDEEIMGGWDAIYGGEHDVHGAITCPRCGSLLTPKIAYKEMTLEDALHPIEQLAELPPQVSLDLEEDKYPQVTYLSPSSLRDGLERAVDRHGESILEREKLRELFPELFFNLWWFCARFQLPLPLAVPNQNGLKHYCAIAAWEYEIAVRGCYSCAKVLLDVEFSVEHDREEFTQYLESLGDYPLLSKINLSGYYANVWDHPDLSEILVALVDACDKRDFKLVIDTVIKTGKFDCYRTILYLAKYQCTSAFQAFFPATIKPCKGYHFWCPIAPVPIFDHLFREAVKLTKISDKSFEVIPEVSDVPLAFRSVFGHLM